MTKTKLSLWPMGIIGALLVFAIFIVSIAVYISKKNVDLESKEYYSESVAYNDIIAMKRAFNNLEEKPELKLLEGKKVSIKFPNSYYSQIDSGNVSFFKPDDASKDFKTNFKKPQASSLSFPFASKSTGVWKVKFTFSIDTTVYYNETEILVD